jgi:hypothetical protein
MAGKFLSFGMKKQFYQAGRCALSSTAVSMNPAFLRRVYLGDAMKKTRLEGTNCVGCVVKIARRE